MTGECKTALHCPCLAELTVGPRQCEPPLRVDGRRFLSRSCVHAMSQELARDW